jgi:hypothetical protein
MLNVIDVGVGSASAHQTNPRVQCAGDGMMLPAMLSAVKRRGPGRATAI